MKFYLSLKRYFIFLLLFVTTTMALSQSKAITGTVKSSDDGSSLPGVNVLEKGTTNGTATNANGDFSLTVGDEATLVFTFIGYGVQEVSVANQSVINVTMVPEITQLSDVVVVGYGTVQKKDLTGAVTSVTSQDFNPGINPNPLQAIRIKHPLFV